MSVGVSECANKGQSNNTHACKPKIAGVWTDTESLAFAHTHMHQTHFQRETTAAVQRGQAAQTASTLEKGLAVSLCLHL